jgi:hypothetical protein
VGPFKDFWQMCANALSDWPRTGRLSVLITVVSVNWVLIHLLVAH